MFLVFRRTTTTASILLIIPLLMWISDWQWKPIDNTFYIKVLFFITETATNPWGIVTNTFLCLWFSKCLYSELRLSISLIGVFVLVILVGQGLKLWIKTQVQEPRPFIVWLNKMNYSQMNKNHNLENRKKKFLIEEKFSKQQKIPVFLLEYWKKETNFSFPSGHTIFSSSWVLFGTGLLWQRKKIMTIILMIWSFSVMESRVLLGMHWPQDLVAAVLISWLLVTPAVWIVQNLLINLPWKNNPNNK